MSGIIDVVTSGRRMAVRLAHPLYGEVLRAGLPPLRMRRVQAELADVVEAHGVRRREDALLVALWRVASGGKVGGENSFHRRHIIAETADAENLPDLFGGDGDHLRLCGQGGEKNQWQKTKNSRVTHGVRPPEGWCGRL